jgi:hypothetical protein
MAANKGLRSDPTTAVMVRPHQEIALQQAHDLESLQETIHWLSRADIRVYLKQAGARHRDLYHGQ